MHDSTAHPPDWALEQMAEGELSREERQTIAAHLEECARCAAEVDAFRTLFSVLSELPRLAPSPEFGDAVMARVQVAPEPSAVMLWLRRFKPSTRRGWTLVAAAAVAPALPLIVLVAWLLSRPMVSPVAVGEWLSTQTHSATQYLFAYLIDWSLGSGLVDLARSSWLAISSVPTGALTVTLVLLAIAMPLSVWSLVRLARTPNMNMTYAS